MKTRLLEIINNGANKLTKDDKIFIKTCALELGLNVPVGTCKSCYIDNAVLLVQEIEHKEEELKNVLPGEDAPAEATTEPGAEERKIFIKKGVDILVNGVRVNRYTVTTDEQAEKLLALIGDKYFEFN